MNPRIVAAVKNVSYSFASNAVTLLIAALVVLIVPRTLGVAEYGYWQLYLFYAAYVGLLQLGWSDGLYLRLGGKDYASLDVDLLGTQFHLLVASQVSTAVVMWFCVSALVHDPERAFIIQATAVCLTLTNSRYMLDLLLQATGRIKEYALTGLVDRLSYFFLVIGLLVFGAAQFRVLIAAHLLGRLASVLYAVYMCRNIVWRRPRYLRAALQDAKTSIKSGISLMFAGYASLAILGVVRFGIERSWDVETFGRVSLVLTASSFITVFTSSVGMVMYPILRRVPEHRLPGLHDVLRDLLMTGMFLMLVLYYPFKTFMSSWLPQYAESMVFMALVFPVFVFDGRATLLTDTYLKALRKERWMLAVNASSLALAVLGTAYFAWMRHDLNLSVLLILLVVTLRSSVAELLVSHHLRLSCSRDVALEIVLAGLFVYSGWVLDSWWTTAVYGGGFLVYLIAKRRDLVHSAGAIRKLLSQ